MDIFSKIKSRDNRLMNIHEIMNQKVAAILQYDVYNIMVLV